MAVPLSYRGFRITRGDATGEQLALLVPTDYRVLHIASAADETTDWNVANPTHPTVYVHSETTPATDYVAISHNATSGFINVASGTLALQVDGTTYMTLSSTALTFTTVDVVLPTATGLNVGSSTQVTVSDGDGATDLIPEVQALGVGTAFAGGAILAATFNTTNDRTVSPKIILVKGGAATQVATTAVADNEVTGSIISYASDSGDFETPVGAIEFVVDDSGGPGASAIGGSIEFYTTADGGSTLTKALTLTTAQVATFESTVTVKGASATIGVAGTTTGGIILAGATSGTVELRATAAAGTIVFILPAAVGSNGEQLTTNGNAGTATLSWAAAASLREYKDFTGEFLAPEDALDTMLNTKVPFWRYKDGVGTGDHETVYAGPVAQEAPWAMHFGGKILNPINSLGYTVAAFQAIAKRNAELESRIAVLEAK